MQRWSHNDGERDFRINASSKSLSLWLCFATYQFARYLVLLLLIRSEWVQAIFVYAATGLFLLDHTVIRWIVGKHGFPSKIATFVPVPKSDGRVNQAHLSLALYTVLSMVMLILVQFIPTGRWLPSGRSIGPVALANLQLPTQAGVIELQDGHVHHDLGGGVNYTVSRGVKRVYYADPYVDSAWRTSDPVRVWVIHKEEQSIGPSHQFAYVVPKYHGLRSGWKAAVEKAIELHGLKTDENSIMVTLDTRPPAFPYGPTYLQAIGVLYLLTGVYVSSYTSRLVYAKELRITQDLI